MGFHASLRECNWAFLRVRVFVYRKNTMVGHYRAPGRGTHAPMCYIGIWFVSCVEPLART